MDRLIKFKQLFIEGDNGSCACDWKYIEKKHRAVYNKTLQRAGANPKFFIVDWEGPAGRLNQSYPTEYTSRIISEREVAREEIEALLW